MEEVLNEAEDAARAVHLIGHGLRDFIDESEAPALSPRAHGMRARTSKRSDSCGTACSKLPRGNEIRDRSPQVGELSPGVRQVLFPVCAL